MTGDAKGRQSFRGKAAAEGREQVIRFERAGKKVRSGLDYPEEDLAWSSTAAFWTGQWTDQLSVDTMVIVTPAAFVGSVALLRGSN
ncbi:hypothetical protein E4U14_008091, partial [Claviceps sp. LM454 group G7]